MFPILKIKIISKFDFIKLTLLVTFHRAFCGKSLISNSSSNTLHASSVTCVSSSGF
jgi:hypothetical protein